MKPRELKLCKNCRYYKDHDTCTREAVRKVCLVTGLSYTLGDVRASTERLDGRFMSWCNCECGRAGRFYEPVCQPG